MLSQVLTVVGSSWVGLAAGLGHAQTLVWLFAFAVFYTPMAVAVYFLNREMPLEGGLYVWARRSFGDTVGFLTAWNIWAYGLVVDRDDPVSDPERVCLHDRPARRLGARKPHHRLPRRWPSCSRH